MKTSPVLPGLILLSALLTFPVTHAADGAMDTVEAIDVNAAQVFVAQHENAVIIDVRTPLEYEMSHIAGAVNVDVQNESFQKMAGELDRDKTYIVHCTKNPAGGRSSRALETLRALGFENLYNLEGGYLAWKDAELPLTETSE